MFIYCCRNARAIGYRAICRKYNHRHAFCKYSCAQRIFQFLACMCSLIGDKQNSKEHLRAWKKRTCLEQAMCEQMCYWKRIVDGQTVYQTRMISWGLIYSLTHFLLIIWKKSPCMVEVVLFGGWISTQFINIRLHSLGKKNKQKPVYLHLGAC